MRLRRIVAVVDDDGNASFARVSSSARARAVDESGRRRRDHYLRSLDRVASGGGSIPRSDLD